MTLIVPFDSNVSNSSFFKKLLTIGQKKQAVLAEG